MFTWNVIKAFNLGWSKTDLDLSSVRIQTLFIINIKMWQSQRQDIVGSDWNLPFIKTSTQRRIYFKSSNKIQEFESMEICNLDVSKGIKILPSTSQTGYSITIPSFKSWLKGKDQHLWVPFRKTKKYCSFDKWAITL